MEQIPNVNFPDSEKNDLYMEYEFIVSLSDAGFICEPKYFNSNIEYALEDCYARSGVVDKLKIAQSFLPEGYDFKIFDAYRPIKVQQTLWDYYYNILKEKNKEISDKELEQLTSYFVSKPSYDIKHPSVHNTGGAIDLTLIKDGKDVDMGAEFDDFTPMSWSNYYEVNDVSDEIKNNRRILYYAMIKAGFTNLPSEFWHYDYGDKFWAFYTGNKPIYQGILNNTDSHFKKFHARKNNI
jgi:D-alanyl-D-alanine dipeptidase